MNRTTISKTITFEFDDFKVLLDVKNQIHVKNESRALHWILANWADLRETHKKIKEQKIIINPLVNP
jgi:hypothetical protein